MLMDFYKKDFLNWIFENFVHLSRYFNIYVYSIANLITLKRVHRISIFWLLVSPNFHNEYEVNFFETQVKLAITLDSGNLDPFFIDMGGIHISKCLVNSPFKANFALIWNHTLPLKTEIASIIELFNLKTSLSFLIRQQRNYMCINLLIVACIS